MQKHKIKALDRQLDAIYGAARSLYEAIEDELAAGRPVLIESAHHEHVADIVGTLLTNSPSLSGDHALLLQLREQKAARERVRDALTLLHRIDGAIFEPAPTVKQLALWKCGGSATADMWAQQISSANYMTNDARRREALRFRRESIAHGRELPGAEHAEAMPSRDAARRDEHRRGAGVNASRRS